jgi:thiamine-phosphate diphosphorylase
MASGTVRSGLTQSGLFNSLGRLYFITMDEAPIGPVDQVKAACEAGIRWIQLRMKQASDAVVRETALAAMSICDTRGCVLIINDRVEIAAAVGAHGVHLGNEDMGVAKARLLLGEDKIIGGTANTPDDIRRHFFQGADYVGLGPYRYTTTKKNLSPVLGLEGYRQAISLMAKERITIPVFAIGGIELEDARVLMEAGLYGIAFSGMLIHEEDRPALVRKLEEEIKNIFVC